MDFAAKQVSISEDYGSVVLGFVDDEQTPSIYVLLQRALEPSKQDRELGHDRVHLQVGESAAGYCDFDKVILSQDGLSLSLTKEAAKQLDTDEAINIRLPPERSKLSDVVAACKKVFGEGGFQLRDEAR